MDLDLGRLFVTNVAIHEVPKAGAASGAVLADSECELDDAMRNYFAERLRTSLATASHDVTPDSSSPSTVPTLIGSFLGNTATLLDISQELARNLFTVQTGVNNPGVIAVAAVTVAGLPGLAILKLEKETGMRGDLEEAEGRRVFHVDLIKNLFFTEKTRVFKAAVFMREGASVVGKVSDQQSSARSLEIAQFFLTTFLGCGYAVAPETSTRDFYDAVQGWINEKVPDAVTKTRYEIALLSELSSEHTELRPRDFAQDHVAVDDRQSLIDHLNVHGVTQQSFRKDNHLIAPSLRRVEYKFRSGIRVVVQPDSIEAGFVSVDDLDDGRTHLEIRDSLERMSGRG